MASDVKWPRRTLAVILAFVAINAFGGGVYGVTGARHVPKEWLKGTPFSDYFIPSLILFFVVGGSSVIAAVAVMRNGRHATLFAILAGLITIGWIAAQITIIGFVSWLQPAVMLTAISEIALALRLHAANRTRAQGT